MLLKMLPTQGKRIEEKRNIKYYDIIPLTESSFQIYPGIGLNL